MGENKLYKSEKLCSKIEIERLYSQGTSVICYPLRAVYLIINASDTERFVPARFLISIPKKRIRHAVDRVLLRRRTRESYRLNRHLLYPTATNCGKTVLIGFNWLSTSKHTYATTEKSMQDILKKIAASITDAQSVKNEL